MNILIPKKDYGLLEQRAINEPMPKSNPGLLEQIKVEKVVDNTTIKPEALHMFNGEYYTIVCGDIDTTEWDLS